ncbi:stage III sporulation protein AF [Brassicibacter mesophilus]|uniref:stage III sporulation protein AF n=1 Tax=Brassicibacter mesophilus TaxID=745119 RepID=UPI003D1B7CE5
MINFMREWIINIVIMIVFVTFLEIILPSSNMKRYIQMIIGLLIIIVLINPFINLITKDINIEREVFANIGESFSYDQTGNSEYIELQNKQIINMYKQKLHKEISEMVSKEGDFDILNLDIDIIEDSIQNNYGDITRIELAIMTAKKEGIQKNDEIKVNKIQDVVISTLDSDSTKSIQTSESCKKIQKKISEYYKISEDKVLVYLETES